MTEQRRKQEQAAIAAQVYRDKLLKEGVTCILTYAAHMNDLTSTLTQLSQEQVGLYAHLVDFINPQMFCDNIWLCLAEITSSPESS